MTSLSNPRVSIVIPSYNHAKFVQESIQSVIDQDYQNIELIIIDDGSTDNSVDAIQQMVPACEKRFVRFKFRHRPNKGLPTTLNEALDWCKGEFFAPLASDDRLKQIKTSLQVNYLLINPQCVGVFGGIEVIDDVGKVLKKVQSTPKCDFQDIFTNKHFLPASTGMLRLIEVKEIQYNRDLIIEDWFMWLMLTKGNNSTLESIPKTLAEYRFHDNNFSKNIIKMHKGRLLIISRFFEHRLYKKSFASCVLITANDYINTNLNKSIIFFLKAIKSDINIVFTGATFKYILKVALPNSFILFLCKFTTLRKLLNI